MDITCFNDYEERSLADSLSFFISDGRLLFPDLKVAALYSVPEHEDPTARLESLTKELLGALPKVSCAPIISACWSRKRGLTARWSALILFEPSEIGKRNRNVKKVAKRIWLQAPS